MHSGLTTVPRPVGGAVAGHGAGDLPFQGRGRPWAGPPAEAQRRSCGGGGRPLTRQAGALSLSGSLLRADPGHIDIHRTLTELLFSNFQFFTPMDVTGAQARAP